MANKLDVDVSVVADSGPGLAFIAYPSAIVLMPVPQLWASFFFIMILLLGVDSQFVNLEGLFTSISDTFPFFYTGRRRKLLLLAICVACFLLCLLMVTEGGLYIFLLFDFYAANGLPLMLFAVVESICIGWVYGADRYYENITDMIGYRPSLYMKCCWKFITPAICTCILLLSLIKFTPLKYNSYQYPGWGYAPGVFLAISSTLPLLVWVIYVLSVTPGTLKQRLKVLCSPANRQSASPNKTHRHETPQAQTELCALKMDERPVSCMKEDTKTR